MLLGNATADCQTPYNGGLQDGPGLRLVVPCYQGMQLQIARRLKTVVSRCSWVVSGCAVLLENATADW